jgi:hypothetical protein
LAVLVLVRALELVLLIKPLVVEILAENLPEYLLPVNLLQVALRSGGLVTEKAQAQVQPEVPLAVVPIMTMTAGKLFRAILFNDLKQTRNI